MSQAVFTTERPFEASIRKRYLWLLLGLMGLSVLGIMVLSSVSQQWGDGSAILSELIGRLFGLLEPWAEPIRRLPLPKFYIRLAQPF
jgi:hypothetical protein